jgi:ATP-binding cassette subfamily B protein
VRVRVLLIISNLINLSISTDLWKKLSKIAISYFDIHPAGDTLQRINDTKQIQTFLTGPGVYTLISFVNFILFGFVLSFYNFQLTLIFVGGTIAYFIWIKLFLKARKKINYKIFQASAKLNNSTLELVQGMQEIRLNNAEESKLNSWESSQKQLFSFNIKFLTCRQTCY